MMLTAPTTLDSFPLRSWRRGWTITAAMACTACHDLPTSPFAVPDVRQWVTGEARAALDADGHFVIVNRIPPGPFPAMSEQRASELAVEFIRIAAYPTINFGAASLGDYLQKQHGGRIDFKALVAHPRVVLAQWPYEDLPAGSPGWARNGASPYYLVRLLDQGIPAVTVAVAAYATDLDIRDGLIVFPKVAGNEFQSYGIPLDSGYRDPIGPEEAVAAAAQETGALVIRVPELIRPDRRFGFVDARWKITLDRQVTLRDPVAGTTHTTDELYVGILLGPTGGIVSHRALQLPAATQPAGDTLSLDPLILLRRRTNFPVAFREVQAGRR